jgi:hypothetical protein
VGGNGYKGEEDGLTEGREKEGKGRMEEDGQGVWEGRRGRASRPSEQKSCVWTWCPYRTILPTPLRPSMLLIQISSRPRGGMEDESPTSQNVVD